MRGGGDCYLVYVLLSHCCAVAAVVSASFADSLSLLDLLSDSLSSRGLAPPKILAALRPSAIELTGSFTVRGSSFSRGRAAASSANIKPFSDKVSKSSSSIL